MKTNSVKKVLMTASVPSMIGQFNMDNIHILKEMGYEVHVACNFQDRSVWTGEKTAQFQKKMYENGVACRQVEFSRSPFALARHIRAYRCLCDGMKKEGYAFVHCHTPIAGAITRLAAARTGQKVLYTAHGFHFYRHGPMFHWLTYYPAERFLSRLTDILVTMNREDFRIARTRMHAGDTEYIPGVGVDTRRFQPWGLQKEWKAEQAEESEKIEKGAVWEGQRESMREEKRRQLGLAKEDIVLLSVGELSRRKNHRLVLEALARIQGTHIRYVICGIGEQETFLKKEAERLGLSERVVFAGYRTDVADFYHMADLFVFPSLQEGLPMALMEAMASGLPCLASDIRGNRDLLEAMADTCLFSLDGTDDFLEKMEALIGNPLLLERVRKKNWSEIQKFDRKRVNRQMRMIYERMGEEKQKKAVGREWTVGRS